MLTAAALGSRICAVITYKWHLAGVQECALPVLGSNVVPDERDVQGEVVVLRQLADPCVHVPHLLLTEVGCQELLGDSLLLRLQVRQQLCLQRLHLTGELFRVVAAGIASEQLRGEKRRGEEKRGEEGIGDDKDQLLNETH